MTSKTKSRETHENSYGRKDGVLCDYDAYATTFNTLQDIAGRLKVFIATFGSNDSYPHPLKIAQVYGFGA